MSRFEFMYPSYLKAELVVEALKREGIDATIISDSTTEVGELGLFDYMVMPIYDNQEVWHQTQFHIKVVTDTEYFTFFCITNDVMFMPLGKYHIYRQGTYPITFFVFDTLQQYNVINKVYRMDSVDPNPSRG